MAASNSDAAAAPTSPAPAATCGRTLTRTRCSSYDDPQRLPPGLKDYALIESTAEHVSGAVAGSRGVRLDSPFYIRNSLAFQSAIAYALRRNGLPIAAPTRLVKEMGSQYRPDATAYDRILSIRNPNAKPPPGARLIVRNGAVAVMMRPWIPRPSRSSAP